MKYRCQIDVAFEKEQDAKDIFNLVKEKQLKAVFFKKETPRVNYHKCFHDESPNKPCEKIEEIKFIKQKNI